jgi:hypothetical protein
VGRSRFGECGRAALDDRSIETLKRVSNDALDPLHLVLAELFELPVAPFLRKRAVVTSTGRRRRPRTRSTGRVPLWPFRSRRPLSVNSNSTVVPVQNPNRSRTFFGTVIWPFEESRCRR